MNTTFTNTARITLLCTSVFVANAAWSCPEGAGAASAANPGDAQSQVLSGDDQARSHAPTATELHALFHDPGLNKPDGLGDYAQNYRAAYPH